MTRKGEEAERPGWIVWCLDENGNKTLRAICLTQGLAGEYRTWAMHEPGIIRSFVERVKINHLYAGCFRNGFQ